ncbi:oligosaccharide flippase family protein [Novosphingobium resinovorum]|uniref:oligosaccharide flippase family protein n=1 Tax=Novosphingobium resinovorum TaxID=158500 RepID=UPI002ED079DD|nr:oligosaccharide flippase family protein [Novosphingobium resinovorum]
MSVAANIAKGMIWLVSGRLGNALLSLASTAVLARLLAPGDFGVMAAAWIVIALANVLFDGAFGQNLLRKRSARPEDVRTTLTMGLLVAGLLVLMVAGLAPGIETFFAFPHLAGVLTVSALVIPCKAVFAVATSQLQLQGRFGVMAAGTLVAAFIGNFLVGIPLGLLGYGVWALVAAAVVTGAAEAALLAVNARMPVLPLLERKAMREVFGAGFFSLANIMNWAANTGSNAVVGRVMGDVSLGLYSRGWKLLDLFVAATATPLSRVLLPSFAKLREDRDRLSAALIDVLGLVLPAYAVASVLLTLHAPWIVAIVLGSKWVGTIPVAQVMFATVLPRCAVKVSENFAVANGRARSTATRQGLYAVLMIGGTLLGTHWGVLGVAIAASVAICIFYLVSMRYATGLGQVSLATSVQLHCRALAFAALIGAADGAMLWLLSGQGMAIRHPVAGLAGMLAGIRIATWSPDFWFGKRNAAKLLAALTATRARMPGFLRYREQNYGS